VKIRALPFALLAAGCISSPSEPTNIPPQPQATLEMPAPLPSLEPVFMAPPTTTLAPAPIPAPTPTPEPRPSPRTPPPPHRPQFCAVIGGNYCGQSGICPVGSTDLGRTIDCHTCCHQ
jgi:hypothetical protein